MPSIFSYIVNFLYHALQLHDLDSSTYTVNLARKMHKATAFHLFKNSLLSGVQANRGW